MPPSLRRSPSRTTGRRTTRSAQLALIADASRPSRSVTGSLDGKRVASAANGRRSSAKVSGRWRAQKRSSREPARRAGQKTARAISASSCQPMPAAKAAPIRLPALVPVTTAGPIPASVNALMTPMCASPAPSPRSARARRGGSGGSRPSPGPIISRTRRALPTLLPNRTPNVVARPHDAWERTASRGGGGALGWATAISASASCASRWRRAPTSGHVPALGRPSAALRRRARRGLRAGGGPPEGRGLVSDAPARIHRRSPPLGAPAVGALPALRPVEGVRARGAGRGGRLSRRRRGEWPPPPGRLPPAFRPPRRVVRAREERAREPGLRLRHAAYRALGLDDPRAAGSEPDAAPLTGL